jgi:hypothetical protein
MDLNLTEPCEQLPDKPGDRSNIFAHPVRSSHPQILYKELSLRTTIRCVLYDGFVTQDQHVPDIAYEQ